MSENIIERIKSYFNDEFFHQASNSLDESSEGISKAVSAIIPVGMEGIARKATSNNDEAKNIYELSHEAETYYSPAPNLSDLHNDEKGSLLSTKIFGNNESHINSAIAKYSGIRDSSVAALSTLTMPVIMGFIGKHASENDLSANGLAGFLSSQKSYIREAMPEGMAIVKDMEFNSTRENVVAEPTDVEVSDSAIVERPKKKTWLVPIILIAIAIALLIYFSKGCGEVKISNESPGVNSTHTIQNE
jgi:hypothetical protein